MKNLKLTLGLFLAFIFVSQGLPALEITRGKVKLEVSESNGRFSLYSTADVSNPLFVPLLYAVDPTTTKVYVKIGTRTIVLGDTSYFSHRMTKSADGIQILWTSPFLKILETWTFVTSVNSPVADGVRWDFRLETGSLQENVGLKILLDTYLGEKATPFLAPGYQPVDSETVWTTPPDYIVSPSSTNSQIGLMVMLSSPSTPPDRTVAANWKRLNDSPWDFEAQPGRDFSLLPYSYNDSALELWYNPQLMTPNHTREISLFMGAASAGTFVNAKIGSGAPVGVILDKTVSDVPDLSKSAKADLQILDDLLNQIADKQKKPESLTPADEQAMQETLDRLEKQKQIFKSTAP
ncbi:MAG: hypothetical protein HKM06_03290 [Spirochaetales bacterium]|nr:hypothetical protein [Spirochaetales bacterium]